MLITFRTYSKILDQWFVQEKIVDKMSDFTLYAKALYSGNYEIIKIEKIKEDKKMNYYKSELSRINIESEVVRVQVGDFDGNKTKYFNLNNVESINALRDFLNQREKNIRENKKMNYCGSELSYINAESNVAKNIMKANKMKLRPIGKNQTELEINTSETIFFSYSTPVAANLNGQVYRTSENHSATTTRHINSWLNGARAVYRDQSFFDQLITICINKK